MTSTSIVPDFGDRTGPDGEVIDEFLHAYIAVAPEAGDATILLAMGLCDARLGRAAPDWARALRRFRSKVAH